MTVWQLFWLEPVTTTSTPPKPGQKGQCDAQQDAGGERKIDPEVAILVGEVPGQLPQPARATPGPQPGARQREDDAGDEEKLSEVLHGKA